ncbi:unnamed protein product [Dimorphilus gyrociliatus]|uniref:Methyltransferase FkbM domain-containing protein n=1 Tax=Dimorphilus gyrociliatus TaxID=2664684 RepID=A0A7I8VM69_9ANNE|nr:unnamed protein product [Dimorphilus gyrociliatus]
MSMSTASIFNRKARIILCAIIMLLLFMFLFKNMDYTLFSNRFNIYLQMKNGTVYRVKFLDIPASKQIKPQTLDNKPRSVTTMTNLATDFNKKLSFLGNLTYSKGNVQVYNLSLPNNDRFKCVSLRQGKNTPICLYDTKVDLHVSGSLARTGSWEAGYLNQVKSFLMQRPKAGLIDLGTNLGVYTLFISKTLQRPVLSVEPYYPTIRRLHKSIKLGKLEKFVTLVVNPITDTRETVYFRRSSNNQGDTRISQSKTNDRGLGPNSSHSILMDDLSDVANFTEAVMKVDIQGYEMKAFSHSKRFLDKVKIFAIFIEWEFYRNSKAHPLVPGFLEEMKARGLKPYSPGRIPLALTQWRKWPFDVVFKSDEVKW